ncbi:hypothetical protein KGQ20_16595 [Catenulispora sp. NF23]|uniref:Lipoprotein n=1 Tax=Catenulispora pinistramenti TaxID=2705254 RepID=A0ABS5KYM2_9ACTN|nr:hypothetical protein [Catenulispora pinistramenti]MBS2534391.1 hypothetical protein [Catenulispora pinistramenti]MBS2551158.1 hypothetical protein [Catenulispora pinistramenti]
MGLFGKKSGEEQQADKRTSYADHPVFTLTTGMSTDQVAERIGPATETKTAAEVAAEFAGPGAVIDPAKLDPEEYWSYDDTPEGFNVAVLFREGLLTEVRVRKNGTNDIVARIDDQGLAAAKSYRGALHANRL